ncbi:hypothetical protein CL628_00720 [bacterium]|nr:hypothetical protein [bacterium]
MAFRVLISTPSGYNAREILLPLREQLEAATDIDAVQVVTPAAPWHKELFPSFGDKFSWHTNPQDESGHRALLEQLKPDVVVTPTVGLDVLDTRILRAAKQLDIPTLTFVASWDNVFKMERLFSKGHSGSSKAGGGDYELPDHYAVWNTMNKEHLLAVVPGVTDEMITITGPPRFDYFAHHDRIPSRNDLGKYLELDGKESCLIHCATTELYPFTYVIEALAQARDGNKLSGPVELYASVHPGGDIAKHRVYESFGARVRYSFGRRDTALHPDFKYVPTDEETYMLIALFTHTSVLVNQSSTVAIESMAADVPVINVKYGKPWDWLGWRRSMVYRDFQQHYLYITDEGGTSIVKSTRELVTAVNAYLDDPALHKAERMRTLQKMITHTDGSCGTRLLDVIRAIV